MRTLRRRKQCFSTESVLVSAYGGSSKVPNGRSLSLSPALSRTLFLSLSLARSHSLSLALALALSRSRSLSLSFVLCLLSLSLSLSLSVYSLSLYFTHTNTQKKGPPAATKVSSGPHIGNWIFFLQKVGVRLQCPGCVRILAGISLECLLSWSVLSPTIWWLK